MGAGPAVTITGTVIVWVGALCVIWGYIASRRTAAQPAQQEPIGAAKQG
jgi:hypothetical protein